MRPPLRQQRDFASASQLCFAARTVKVQLPLRSMTESMKRRMETMSVKGAHAYKHPVLVSMFAHGLPYAGAAVDSSLLIKAEGGLAKREGRGGDGTS